MGTVHPDKCEVMKMKIYRYWVLALSCWLLAACSSSDGTAGGGPQNTMLSIYVYSPEHPMVIRGTEGNVNPLTGESAVNKLQIWVFESGTGNAVGYLETTETSSLNTTVDGVSYQIPVSDEFAQHKPAVDVIVLANVASDNSGCSFSRSSTREELLNAKMGEGYFGLSTLTTSVPASGLPMSGMLKNQTVTGEAPVLRIGTVSQMATVSLVRVVSKLRFAFANTDGANTMSIQRITLAANTIPKEEYLLSQGRMSSEYNTETAEMLPTPVTAVQTVANPTVYLYINQESQDYENLINNAELTKVGPFYLRESDKRLEGKIYYKIGDEEKEADFQMAAAGDFLRNHTWIVYAYHVGGGFLQLNTLYVKDWTNLAKEHAVYNW